LANLLEKIASSDSAKQKLRLLMTFSVFCVVIFTLLLIFDKVLIPYWVHDRDKVKVPNVKGMELEQAKLVLSHNNLYYEVVSEVFNPKLPKGTVISQTPEPNRDVKSRRPIFLTLSKGNELVVVPNIIGMTSRKAKTQLLKEGFDVKDNIYFFNESTEKDIVIGLSKVSGSKASYGDTITVFVSKGKQVQEYIPSVIGSTLPEAEALLKSKGLILGKISHKLDETFVNGTVMLQSPDAGLPASEGMAIDLIISTTKK